MGKKNSAHRSRKGFSLLITLFRWERMGKFGKEWERMGKRPLRLLYLCTR